MEGKTKFVKKYEWVGDVKSYKEPEENEHSIKYNEPNREYDSEYKPTKEDIETFPDLQNGPSSLIQGSPVEIQQVGINMSRIMRSFYEFKNDVFSIDKLETVLSSYKDKLKSFDAKIALKFSYPIIQPSLRSGLEGYQYYDVTLEGNLDKSGVLKKIIHFDFVYSSACPCSYELAEFARKYRNKATVSHSQRSVTRISIEFDELVWIEDLKEMCDKALHTETQVIVKREDEMAFAELNGSYLKFVEDAARLLYEQLVEDKRIKDFRVICSHQESLHSHDAVSVILAPDSKFCADVPHELWSSLIHIS
jgi:GTP cyclohydrolase I